MSIWQVNDTFFKDKMDVIDLKSQLKEFYIGSRVINWDVLTIKFSKKF